MKLRIRDDSMRLRLAVSEVDAIGAGNAVTGRIRFPGGNQLIYSLRPDADCSSMTAGFDPAGSRLEVRLPMAAGRAWHADPLAIGMRAVLPMAEGAELTLLVEKDFACLDPGVEQDETDTFERPASGRPASGRPESGRPEFVQ